jgi:hypothetical protein
MSGLVTDGTALQIGRTAVCAGLLAAIAARDYPGIAGYFAADARLSVLTPHRLREESGADAAAALYRYWLEPLAGFEVLESDCAPIADRVRIRYRFRGVDPAHGSQENDHTGYATVEAGRIVQLNLTCAGFRPVARRTEGPRASS